MSGLFIWTVFFNAQAQGFNPCAEKGTSPFPLAEKGTNPFPLAEKAGFDVLSLRETTPSCCRSSLR